MVAFTGAGVSTSAGIPDYRSGIDTCLATGPGQWIRDYSKNSSPNGKMKGIFKSMSSSLIPTNTHMGLAELHRFGKLKHLISQNVDGLHRKSGIPA